MKKSKKILIENYIDLRCKKLLEEQWGKLLKDIGTAAFDMNPIGGAINSIGDYRSYRKDIASGTDPKTAKKNMIDRMLDRKQMSLDIGGAIPIVGAAPDLINMGISGARAGYEHKWGDPNKAADHENYAALSGVSAIPIVGYGGLVAKYGPRFAKALKLGTKGYTKGDKYADKYDLETGTGGTNTQTAGPPNKGIFSKLYDIGKDVFSGKHKPSTTDRSTHTKDHTPHTFGPKY